MPDLKNSRQKVKIAIASMIVLDLLAIALLFSPLIGSERSRRQEMDGLWRELQVKTRQVEPLRGLDKKIVLAQQQINDFYKERLPSEASSISQDLGKLAGQSGVKITSIKYTEKDAEVSDLQRVEINADLSGDYLQLVRFINGLERNQLFFLIDSVGLESEQGGVVKLQMKLETYLKTNGSQSGA
jgi:Tfp pilus assembly protein PilO